jgi:hypothetical protein
MLKRRRWCVARRAILPELTPSRPAKMLSFSVGANKIDRCPSKLTMGGAHPRYNTRNRR